MPATEIRVAPQPVTPALMQRAPQLTPERAQAIVEALQQGGMLDQVGCPAWLPAQQGQGRAAGGAQRRVPHSGPTPPSTPTVAEGPPQA